MRRLVVAVSAVVFVAVAALVAAEAGVPIGGVSRGEAVAAAKKLAKVQSSTPPQVAWAVPGLFGFFRGGATDAIAPWGRWVWAVRLTGTYRGSCPPTGVTNGQGPLRCSPDDHTETVILDYRTGVFIMASVEP